MELYFKGSNGHKRVIGEPETEKDAHDMIRKFCEERNFTIHYIRTWVGEDGGKVFDVGSWSEFFILFDSREGYALCTE